MLVLSGDIIRQEVRVGTGADRLCGIGGCTTKVPALPSEKVSHASFHVACPPGHQQHAQMSYLCYTPHL
jgi:hypothetical protein